MMSSFTVASAIHRSAPVLEYAGPGQDWIRSVQSGDVLKRPALHALQLGHSWFNESPAGPDRYFAELLQHLPAAGVSGHGLVAGYNAVSNESGGSVRSVAPVDSRLWARWRAFRDAVSRDLSEGGVDLIASHHSLYTLPVLAQIRGLPLVMHFHGPFAAESSTENTRQLENKAKYWMERAVYSRAVRFICLSNAFATILHESYRVPRRQIRIIPGGVETLRFDPPDTRVQARARLGWPTDRPIVFSVRRLMRRMGLENLIDAVQSVRAKVPDVLVMIAGKGILAAELKDRINFANLQDHVRLLGFMPDADLPLAYRAADLTVVPTVSLEGFGLTTVESLAAGTPAIVTPVGGSPETVGGLSPDLIVPDWTPAALSAALTAALRGDLKLPDAQACQSFVRGRFDWSIVTSRIRDVYEEAVLAFEQGDA